MKRHPPTDDGLDRAIARAATKDRRLAGVLLDAWTDVGQRRHQPSRREHLCSPICRRHGTAARAAGLVVALLLLLATVAHAAPDLTTEIVDVATYAEDVAQGFVAYAVGSRACNRGTSPLNVCAHFDGCAPDAGIEDHPVIIASLHRLLDGRMEQIGVSWLKHVTLSPNENADGCRQASPTGSCQPPPFGPRQLGIGCALTYTAELTGGGRPHGRPSTYNPTLATGPYPPDGPAGPWAAYEQRVKVDVRDLDPVLNPGALYFVEVRWSAPDDAAAGNGLNNSSTRRVIIGPPPTYTATLAPE